jgi:predicted ATPase
MRKGIADLHRRAEVSQKTNERLLNALASVDDSRSVEELTVDIQKHTGWRGRRVRGLRPWAEDKDLLTAISHGEFLINGVRNRDLQKLLYSVEPESPIERRRRSAAIGRKLRLLRAHGLIQKVSRTHRYNVTETGRAILVAVLTTARTSLNQLNRLEKAA